MSNLEATTDVAPWALAARLQHHRHRSGLTQAQVAQKSGIPRMRYSDFERGHVRPRRVELERLARVFGVTATFLIRGSDWSPPRPCPGRPQSTLRQRCSLAPQHHVPLAAYLQTALEKYPALTMACLQKIRSRLDMPRIRQFLRDVPCHSVLEAVTILALLALGGRPVWESPLRVGFRKWPVLLEGRQAGDLRHPGLQLEFKGVSILFLFQVTLQVHRGGKPVVDALVTVRENRKNRWVVLEIDGPLHVADKDRERHFNLDLMEVRLEWEFFRDSHGDPALEICERIMRTLQIDTSPEACSSRMKARGRQARHRGPASKERPHPAP